MRRDVGRDSCLFLFLLRLPCPRKKEKPQAEGMKWEAGWEGRQHGNKNSREMKREGKDERKWESKGETKQEAK
jgi:hypothetical protein